MVGAGTAGELLANALHLERLAGGRLPDHSGDDLRVAIAIQHLRARGCLIPVRAAGERGSVQSGGVRISVESAPIKGHIRAGCPHPAAQGKRIPTPVTAGHTGPALQGAAVIRADRVVRPYKAEQEPRKYGKAPLQLCRRGASAYSQSSMLLRSTATSKGAAVASLI